MRRPLKPFVTEYRGGGRRQASAQGPGPKQDPKVEGDRPASRGSEARPPQSAPSTSAHEDSYEAALRAADALFSARPRQPVASIDPPISQVEDPAGAASGAPQTAAAPQSPGGRILRAIDEPPPPELLRLEAEFAPKRRGRKPGSKNKPKMLPPLTEAAAVMPDPVPVGGLPQPLAAAKKDERIAVAHVPMQAVPGPMGPRGDRYAWVRTKLKPGQQWKRRIPKVAW